MVQEKENLLGVPWPYLVTENSPDRIGDESNNCSLPQCEVGTVTGMVTTGVGKTRESSIYFCVCVLTEKLWQPNQTITSGGKLGSLHTILKVFLLYPHKAIPEWGTFGDMVFWGPRGRANL